MNGFSDYEITNDPAGAADEVATALVEAAED
jgi:hypothetical protein